MAMGTDFPSVQSFVFHPKPEVLLVTEREPESYLSTKRLEIEILINKLAKGPIFCIGSIGPNTYTRAPSIQEKIVGHDIYGWSQGVQRDKLLMPTPNIILGARKMENGVHYVFFTPAISIPSDDLPEGVHQEQPSPMDQRIYKTSLENFYQFITKVFFAPSQEELGLPMDPQAIEEKEKFEPIEPISPPAVPENEMDAEDDEGHYAEFLGDFFQVPDDPGLFSLTAPDL